MAQSLTITFFFVAFASRVSLAKDNIINEQIALQTTSLLQTGSFHIGENEKDKAFSSTPLTHDTWGRDQQDEDAEDEDSDSSDMLDSQEGDVDSEGISELQVSTERAVQHAVQYPPASPIMVQSQGSVPIDREMPGTLRQAVVQSISQAAAPLTTPLGAPVAGLVATSSESENTSGAAFSQLSALEAEFKELREDDSSHVKQLMYTVHLREQLRDQLRTAQEQLVKDNQHLAERTAEIVVASQTSNQGASSEGRLDNEGAPNNTVAAMLLQAAISSRKNRELTGQQIAAEALDRVASLMQDIAALRKRDEDEMQTLRSNAASREALQAKIDNRKEQLQSDAGALLVDLGKIRGLVQHEEVQSDPAAQPGPDTQDGPKVASDAQAPTTGEQPIAMSQEQMAMIQQAQRQAH